MWGGDVMKRNRCQIISQILEICIGGSNITKIIYQANINFKNANMYIDLLIKYGMLNVNQEPTKKYETTEKGIKFLHSLKKLRDELPEL
jgi:predicted transcriptional regulator